MIDDITYDSLIFIYETPESTPGGITLGYSYDGDNFDFQQTSGGTGEVSFIFIS